MRNNNVAGQPGFINSMALVKVLPCVKSLEIFSDSLPQFLLPMHQGTDKIPSNSSNLGVMVQRSDQGLRVHARQIRLHHVTQATFLALGVPGFASVKWVGASNNCLIDGLKMVIHMGLNPLQEPDSEPLFIFQSSDKFISFIFPVPALLLTYFSFKFRLST